MEGNILVKSKTYLWLEDRKGKSSYIFWKTFMEQLCPEIVVESKKNNSELVKAVKAREKLVSAIKNGELNYKDIQEMAEYCEKINSYNVEQLSAKILFDLTRNTGFEVSKGKIGECWIKSCCEWQNRMDDDICGLDSNRLHLSDKMKHIYKGTSLATQFQNIGLEVL